MADDNGTFCTIEEALDELRAGRMIVLVDDQFRENEGDLVIAADRVTPETVNFMLTHARGILCLAMYVVKPRAFREPGVGMRASDIVYGVVVLAIWVLICAGLFGWFSGRPPEVWRFAIAIELPLLAVTSYTVVVLAFVVRKGLRDIPAAYRAGKRQRAEARRGLRG